MIETKRPSPYEILLFFNALYIREKRQKYVSQFISHPLNGMGGE